MLRGYLGLSGDVRLGAELVSFEFFGGVGLRADDGRRELPTCWNLGSRSIEGIGESGGLPRGSMTSPPAKPGEEERMCWRGSLTALLLGILRHLGFV